MKRDDLQENDFMRSAVKVLYLFLAVIMLQPALFALQADTPNPAREKFQDDMKTAVMNGSITVPQVKELKANAETLKSVRENQTPGAPVDLLTPYRAVSKMKAIMATVDAKDRETLREDLQAVLANQPAKADAADPSAGQKLGKDIFTAVMFGSPTEGQVQQLQTSLNSLQQIKTQNLGPLQSLRALRGSKSEIEQVMNAGSFRPQDRQAVLDDLNSLGPQGGGRRR
jgi:hypothetical protein